MKKKKIYIYHNQNLLEIADSLKDAADKTGLQPTTVYGNIKNKKTTRNGYFFTHQELTDEQIQNLEIKRNECIKEIGTQEFEITSSENRVFHFKSKKKDKIEDFKTFLLNKFRKRWMTIPKQVATLEKEYIIEFLKEMER